jgi:hypothetical protein
MFDTDVRMLQKVYFHVGTRNLVRRHVTAFKKAANTPRWPSAHDIRIALNSARQSARHRGRRVRFLLPSRPSQYWKDVVSR